MKKEVDPRLVMALGCVLFVCLGAGTASIGPVLSVLSANTGASLAAIGGIYTALFLGALLAQIAGGPISDRIGQPVVLLVSSFVIAVGLFGVTISHSLLLMLVFGFVAGLGHGTVDLCTNVLISRVFAKRSVSALNLLNFFFGLGAFIGPALVGLAISVSINSLAVLWIFAAVFILALPFLYSLRRLSIRPPEDTGSTHEETNRGSLYRSLLVWLLSLLALVYVGTENGLGGWISTYVNRTTPLGLESSALAASGFWLALTAGRLVTSAVGRRFSSTVILLAGLSGALAGGLLFALSTGYTALTIAAILIIGFSFGPIFPTIVAVITTAYSRSPGKAVGVAAALGSLGGMLIPWLQGVILESRGPSATAWFIFAAIVVMLGLFGISRRGKATRA